MSNVYVLDIETGATNEAMSDYAGLEPWRVRQGNAKIDSIAVIAPDGNLSQIVNDHQDDQRWAEEVRKLIASLKGKQVWAHNALFDIAWIIATLQPDKTGNIPSEVNDVEWHDSMLLSRWLTNGQKAEYMHFSLSLANSCKTFLKGDPDLEDFLDVKAENVTAGQDDAYWERRGMLDVIMTQKLVRFLKPKMAKSQIGGFKLESNCLIPVANSWLLGLRIDLKQLAVIDKEYNDKIDDICKELGISRGVLTSPKQKAALLYDKMGLPVTERTKTGAPCTGKDVLLVLAYNLRQKGDDEHAQFIERMLEASTCATLLSKYVKTTKKALEHTGDGCIYGAPRLFGTYTGRMTYSNATLKKYKTGIALHQIPRKADGVRKMLLPPVGFKLYEADASGQESRLMAIRSKDDTMISIFSQDLNFHSMTGASIIGKDYFDFEELREKEHGSGYHTEQRQLGKLTNLSCNYRISGPTLAKKAYVTYDTYMTNNTGSFLVSTFARSYPGVPDYWKDVIVESRAKGYTEAFGGRRFKLSEWARKRWMTESSAINMPIQGAGASMKEIALHEMHKQVPEAMFLLDLHDATFNVIRDDDKFDSVVNKCDKILNNIDYAPYWGFSIPIPLPYESGSGYTFGDVK